MRNRLRNILKKIIDNWEEGMVLMSHVDPPFYSDGWPMGLTLLQHTRSPLRRPGVSTTSQSTSDSNT